MAEVIFEKMLNERHREDIKADSAGISILGTCGASLNAIEVMNSLGIDISTHQAKQITEDIVNEADVILTMTGQHKDFIKTRFTVEQDKVFTLKSYAHKVLQTQTAGDEIDEDITDPYGFSAIYYFKCAKEIENCLKIIINDIY
jgi:protein-tyrosine-phosphatase